MRVLVWWLIYALGSLLGVAGAFGFLVFWWYHSLLVSSVFLGTLFLLVTFVAAHEKVSEERRERERQLR